MCIYLGVELLYHMGVLFLGTPRPWCLCEKTGGCGGAHMTLGQRLGEVTLQNPSTVTLRQSPSPWGPASLILFSGFLWAVARSIEG